MDRETIIRGAIFLACIILAIVSIFKWPEPAEEPVVSLPRQFPSLKELPTIDTSAVTPASRIEWDSACYALRPGRVARARLTLDSIRRKDDITMHRYSNGGRVAFKSFDRGTNVKDMLAGQQRIHSMFSGGAPPGTKTKLRQVLYVSTEDSAYFTRYIKDQLKDKAIDLVINVIAPKEGKRSPFLRRALKGGQAIFTVYEIVDALDLFEEKQVPFSTVRQKDAADTGPKF